MSVILLSEALRILHSGAVCELSYITADLKRGTGGQIKYIPQCVIWTNDLTENQISDPFRGQGAQGHPSPNGEGPGVRRNPSHFANKTRNIYIPSTRQIQKLHIKLITRFNGKKVLL